MPSLYTAAHVFHCRASHIPCFTCSQPAKLDKASLHQPTTSSSAAPCSPVAHQSITFPSLFKEASFCKFIKPSRQSAQLQNITNPNTITETQSHRATSSKPNPTCNQSPLRNPLSHGGTAVDSSPTQIWIKS